VPVFFFFGARMIAHSLKEVWGAMIGIAFHVTTAPSLPLSGVGGIGPGSD
jgi:hypothetical protein